MVQLFYGTIIHQVLDRAHAHFRGEFGAPAGNASDRQGYQTLTFVEVEKRPGGEPRIRASLEVVRDQALKVLKRFNSIEGPDTIS